MEAFPSIPFSLGGTGYVAGAATLPFDALM